MFGVVGFQPAVLITPPVVGLLGNIEFLAHREHIRALPETNFRLTQLTDDLLRGVVRRFAIAESARALLSVTGNIRSNTLDQPEGTMPQVSEAASRSLLTRIRIVG